MVAAGSTQTSAPVSSERPLPPITELAVASMALIVIGGIYLAAYVPRTVPLALPVALLTLSGVILIANIVMLSRIRSFAWNRFFQVFKWTLLAYTVIAGMIGYAFITDGTHGSVLVVLVLMLVVFAADIPLLLAFSVARYADPNGQGGS